MDDGQNPYYFVVFAAVLILTAAFLLYLRLRKRTTNGLKNAIHAEFLHSNEDVTEEEIISMVREGHEQGTILASKAEMIHNILEFDDKEAKDIMTHRKNMLMLDGEQSYLDNVSIMVQSGKSRFPVYVDDMDNVIGVLHIKDAFSFFQRNEVFRTPIREIEGLIRSVDFVPETLNINTLFKRMQLKKSHMVMVVDEYGQIAGLVAMEDILEEIVGNIEDEHDREMELIEAEEDGSYLMDGLAGFSEVAEALELPEEDSFDTLNGFLVSRMGRIPNEGENARIFAYGYEFLVLTVEDKMIRKVEVRKAESEEQTQGNTCAEAKIMVE